MTDEIEPRRGEVWLVAFGPALGGEIEKTRPALVLSDDVANARLNRVQLVPLSSQTDRIYPAEARRIDTIGEADLAAVLRVVRIQLGL